MHFVFFLAQRLGSTTKKSPKRDELMKIIALFLLCVYPFRTHCRLCLAGLFVYPINGFVALYSMFFFFNRSPLMWVCVCGMEDVCFCVCCCCCCVVFIQCEKRDETPIVGKIAPKQRTLRGRLWEEGSLLAIPLGDYMVLIRCEFPIGLGMRFVSLKCLSAQEESLGFTGAWDREGPFAMAFTHFFHTEMERDI